MACAGYRLTDQTLTTVWHVRFRDYVPELGIWTRRDPIGYADGFNLYGYVASGPARYADPSGLSKDNRSAYEVVRDNCEKGAAQAYKKYQNGEISADEATCRTHMLCKDQSDKAGEFLGYFRGMAEGAKDGLTMALSAYLSKIPGSGHIPGVDILHRRAAELSEYSSMYDLGLLASNVSAIAADLALGGKSIARPRRTRMVSRWGREGVRHGDFVMIGSRYNPVSYLASGKIQPGFGNNFAGPWEGSTAVVLRAHLHAPREGSLFFHRGPIVWIKWLLGQRRYMKR